MGNGKAEAPGKIASQGPPAVPTRRFTTSARVSQVTGARSCGAGWCGDRDWSFPAR
jgi:hypothetical protein